MISGAAPVPRRDFLFLQSTTEIGGAETVLLNLFEASAELRRRALVVTLGFANGDLPQRLRGFGVEVIELKMARFRYPWKVAPTFRQLLGVVRSSGVRAIIGNGGHPQVIAGAVARLTRTQSVFMAHMIYPQPIWKNDPRDFLALAGPLDLALGVSRSAQEALAKLRPSVPNRLLYNGTPMREVTTTEASAARGELGAAADDVLVGVFGRLQRWKGQDIFVEAAGEVARLRPRTRFAIVGGSVFGLEPEFLEGLRNRVTALGLGDRLVFTGFRSDVARLMAACDVVCHTSRVPEPFGLVIIEAMSLARPVIATAGGGPSEIIATEDHGTLVPAEDPAALTRALLALIDAPERRRQLGASARERVRREFSIDVMASNLIAHLDALIAAR